LSTSQPDDLLPPGCFVVARVDEVPPGCGVSVRVGEREFAVFHSEGRFYVLDGSCPHRGGPLGAGTVDGGSVYCPLHGWKFDLETGAGIDHPEKPVKSWPVRVENGWIQVIEPAAAKVIPPPPPGSD